MSDPRSRIAQILAGSPAAYDSVGLVSPPGQKILENLSHVAAGYGAVNIAQALAAKTAPALEGLGESGAVFPESLPPIKAGSKVGDPHALFAYKDNFGPDMSERSIYNVFGDPSHPAIQKVGWGSSVPQDVLEANGIPITGIQAPR